MRHEGWIVAFEGSYLDSVSPGVMILFCVCRNSLQYFHISRFVDPGTC